MGQIVLLDELTTCKIAAGEVIERPASVVKEMVENSIDAGATSVSVEIKAGGIKYIRISDNGSGIAEDDAEIAFDKHATSKIRSADDLESVATLGFRGEALASIAAVSDVELTTRCPGADSATYVHIKGGKILEKGSKGAGFGTTFVVRDLFYNTPARYKFLKKDSTEAGYICDVLQKLALAHCNVAIRLISGGTELLRTPGNGDLKSTIYSIYGKKIADALRPVNFNENGISITGFVGAGDASAGTRARQVFFVNGRYIKSKTITAALDEGMKSTIMKGRFAFAVLSVEVSPFAVDVNVHPTKIEVRFSDENSLYRAVLKSIPYGDSYGELYEDVLLGDRPGSGLASIIREKSENPVFHFTEEKDSKSMTFENEKTIKRDTGKTWSYTWKDYSSGDFSVGTDPEPVKVSDDMGCVIESETKQEDKPVIRDMQNNLVLTAEEVQITDIAESADNVEEIINPFYVNAKVVGQVFETYIILEHGSSMFLLDQHAAHERLLYEQLKKSYTDGSSVAVQSLLLPITINVSPVEMQIYMNLSGSFQKLGFEIDMFGADAIIIRSIPAVLEGQDVESAIGVLLSKGDRASAKDLIEDEKLYTMACKAAVKGNSSLSSLEIEKLLHDLAVTDRPGTCPHGRPIVVELSKREVEKRFKRVL